MAPPRETTRHQPIWDTEYFPVASAHSGVSDITFFNRQIGQYFAFDTSITKSYGDTSMYQPGQLSYPESFHLLGFNINFGPEGDITSEVRDKLFDRSWFEFHWCNQTQFRLPLRNLVERKINVMQSEITLPEPEKTLEPEEDDRPPIPVDLPYDPEAEKLAESLRPKLPEKEPPKPKKEPSWKDVAEKFHLPYYPYTIMVDGKPSYKLIRPTESFWCKACWPVPISFTRKIRMSVTLEGYMSRPDY